MRCWPGIGVDNGLDLCGIDYGLSCAGRYIGD